MTDAEIKVLCLVGAILLMVVVALVIHHERKQFERDEARRALLLEHAREQLRRLL